MDNQTEFTADVQKKTENRCINCGNVVALGQRFCPICGTMQAPPISRCNNCGEELPAGETFCRNCGYSQPTPVNYLSNDIANPKFTSSKKKIGIIAGIIVTVVLVIIIISSGGSSKNFNDMYAHIANESWCDIASDGTWMKIDTNPYDTEDGFNILAWYKIKSVLSDLGFSSAISEEMNETRALDGRQSASTDNYEVTWSYHPDNGLEVLFKIKK